MMGVLSSGKAWDYTNSSNYYFATNRFVTPFNSPAAVGANVCQCPSVYMGVADFPSHSFRFALASHYSVNSGAYPTEFAATHTITVEGVSVGYGPTNDPTLATWVAGTIGGSAGVVLDPTTNSVGVLTDDIISAGSPIPAGYHRWFRVAYALPSGASLAANLSFFGTTLEGVALGSTSQAAKLTNGAAITSTGSTPTSAWGPCYAVCKGHAGKPVFLVWGNSIGAGQNETSYANFGASTPGFLMRGLDDTSGPGRFFGANFCVPGSRPSDYTTNGRTAVAKKFDILELCPNVPFTHILSEHGTNANGTGWAGSTTGATLIASMKNYCDMISAEFGGVPVAQTTILQKIGATTDGYTTVSGQTPSNGFKAVGSDTDANERWMRFNAKLVLDRCDGKFHSFINTAAIFGDATQADRMADVPWQTTLAAQYTSGDTISVVDAPPSVHYGLTVGADSQRSRTIRSITGTGPYSVRFTVAPTTPGSPLAIGTVVKAVSSTDGLHPAGNRHIDMAAAVIAWKASAF